MKFSETQLLEALLSTPNGVAIIDQDLKYVYCNAGLAAMNGSDPLGFIGKTVREVVPQLADVLEPALLEVLRTGKPIQNLEVEGFGFDRGRVWLEHFQPIFDQSSQVIRVAVIIEEITSRRHSEDRYRMLLKSTNQGFCIFEMLYNDSGRAINYRFLEVNSAFEVHTGLLNAVGKTALELVPDLEQHWVDTYAKVAQSGETHRFELGSIAMGRMFEVEAVRVGREQSRQVALIFTDITERRRSEVSLQQVAQRDEYRVLLTDTLRDLDDPEAVQINAAALLATHLNADRVVYAEVEPDGEHAVIHRDDGRITPKVAGRYKLGNFLGSVINELQAGKTIVVNNVQVDSRFDQVQRQAYLEFHVSAYMSIPIIKNGKLEALLGVQESNPRNWTQDEISIASETAERTWADVKRARLTRLLLARDLKLTALNEAQRRFVSDAAHELRAPLTAIRGNLELLLRYSNISDQERLEMLTDAEREASRLSRLITDLLAVARGDAAQHTEFAPLRLDKLIAESLRVSQHLATHHRLECNELPPVTVMGNNDRLKQLVLVLLENAIKYSEQGNAIKLSLHIEHHTQDQKAVLKIADQGLGIAPEDLSRVFERFYRVDQSRTPGRDPGGTGLGLSIAKLIAEAHGGSVWLESDLGSGTTAIVSLPVMSASNDSNLELRGDVGIV
jgi:PAS domain S-box-containing protein